MLATLSRSSSAPSPIVSLPVRSRMITSCVMRSAMCISDSVEGPGASGQCERVRKRGRVPRADYTSVRVFFFRLWTPQYRHFAHAMHDRRVRGVADLVAELPAVLAIIDLDLHLD